MRPGVVSPARTSDRTSAHSFGLAQATEERRSKCSHGRRLPTNRVQSDVIAELEPPKRRLTVQRFKMP
jgi:hypothetical protein